MNSDIKDSFLETILLLTVLITLLIVVPFFYGNQALYGLFKSLSLALLLLYYRKIVLKKLTGDLSVDFNHPIKNSTTNKQAFLKALDDIYQAAFKAKNYAVAIKAKELQGKAVGFFTPEREQTPFSWQDLSEEQLEALLKDAQTLLETAE